MCDDCPLGMGRAGAQSASTRVTTHSAPCTKTQEHTTDTAAPQTHTGQPHAQWGFTHSLSHSVTQAPSHRASHPVSKSVSQSVSQSLSHSVTHAAVTSEGPDHLLPDLQPSLDPLQRAQSVPPPEIQNSLGQKLKSKKTRKPQF